MNERSGDRSFLAARNPEDALFYVWQDGRRRHSRTRVSMRSVDRVTPAQRCKITAAVRRSSTH